MQCACSVLYFHECSVWLYHIFPHYLINGTIFGEKNVTELKMCVLSSTATLPQTFLILRQIQRHNRKCTKGLLDRFSKNPQTLNLMKIRTVWTGLFNADRQTWQSKIHISQFSSFFVLLTSLACFNFSTCFADLLIVGFMFVFGTTQDDISPGRYKRQSRLHQ